MEHWFNLTWENPPRTTTRAEWKKICRFYRLCRREIESKIDPEEITRCFCDVAIYGTGILKVE